MGRILLPGKLINIKDFVRVLEKNTLYLRFDFDFLSNALVFKYFPWKILHSEAGQFFYKFEVKG